MSEVTIKVSKNYKNKIIDEIIVKKKEQQEKKEKIEFRSMIVPEKKL